MQSNSATDEAILTSAGSVLRLHGDRLQIEMPDVGRLLKLRIWHEKRHPFSGWHLARVRVYSGINSITLLDKLITLIIAGHFAENLDDGKILVSMRPLAGCE